MSIPEHEDAGKRHYELVACTRRIALPALGPEIDVVTTFLMSASPVEIVVHDATSTQHVKVQSLMDIRGLDAGKRGTARGGGGEVPIPFIEGPGGIPAPFRTGGSSDGKDWFGDWEPKEAVGYSDTFSFSEAFEEAVRALPARKARYADELTHVVVLAIGAEFGGIAGSRRMFVKVSG